MGFYSFVVRSTRDVPLPEHLLVIGKGVDTFNAVVPDPEAFCAKLQAEGVHVLEMHQLDDIEPVPVTPSLTLPTGENPFFLGR